MRELAEQARTHFGKHRFRLVENNKMTVAHARVSDGSSDRFIKHPAHNEAFWNESNETLLYDLSTRKEGLTDAEAKRRLFRYGPNLSVLNVRRSLIIKFGKRIAEPLIAILLIAALISGVVGDWQSLIVIVLIVLFSIALDVFQEQKAENTVEALRRSVAVTASVLRDGRPVELAVPEIVPGDVIELRAGDLVPADGIVLGSRAALANEAILTGEPYPTEKRCGPCDAKAPVDAFNALFSGTSLVGGDAIMLVVATGGATQRD